ncbi:MAG: HNH endonuclease [Terriglobia bacterium]
MTFPETVKDQAFARSGGRCECRRQHARQNTPHHDSRCTKLFARHGEQWEAHHIMTGGPDTLSNCEALCLACHKTHLHIRVLIFPTD